jgi:acyl carrier protein
MLYLDRIRNVFATALGEEAASHVAADSTIETVPGWDSLSFLSVVMALETEFGIVIKPRDAVGLFSVAGISHFLAATLPTDNG